ncbi:hypothetical protein [Methylomarinum vadi]|uniref:hypothetical protein n=1 Tax=Methylomarinum vadi TaxID=438855 RepID=UPI0004DF9596|nr:hypothetical protein [Methylomarinum vadi]
MDLLRKVLLAVFVSVAMFATAPATMAAGKIENATAEEVSQAIEDAISNSEKAVAAMQSGADEDTVLGLLKATKQASKRIESNVVDRLRSKANSRIAKSRSAFRKGDKEKAQALATEALDIFKEVKSKYHSF